MTQSIYKEKTLENWALIIENMGITVSTANWMAEYAEIHLKNDISPLTLSSINSMNNSLLPISKQIFSKTVGLDLVSISPIGGVTPNKLDEIKKDVKSENRDRKIESLIDDKDYEEMKITDHPDYKSGLPKGNLFLFSPFRQL